MGTKITLSDKELELVCNTGWILTKHAVMQKVYCLFGEAVPLLENFLQENRDALPAEVFSLPPKISKGENYKLLPYAMLDYPRHFGKDDTLAVRVFFWWGNFFSVSLQLSGQCKENTVSKLKEQFEWLGQEGYFICVGESPWEHHFEENNFIAVNKCSRKEFESILRRPFIKIAKKIPLQEWGFAPAFIENAFTGLVSLLKNNG